MDVIKKFVADRDEMLLKRSVEELKKFVREHKEEYAPQFRQAVANAKDDVLEVTLHKMITAVTSLPEDFVHESVVWLVERGYSPMF